MFSTSGPLRADPFVTNDEFVPDDQIVSDPTSDLPDPEFDIVGDHMVWQDTAGNLWIAWIDPVTGAIFPDDGKGVLVDTNLANVARTGNGPEWGYGQGRAFIVYTKRLFNTTALAMAERDENGDWIANRLTKPAFRWRPEGTAPSNPDPARIVYNRTINNVDVVSWRDLEDPDTEGTVQGVMPQGGRWIEGERSFLTMAKVDDIVQFKLVDLDEGIPVQITFGSDNKLNPFSWVAPEFNAPMFSAMINAVDVGLYRRIDDAWVRTYTIDLPTSKPFVSSPEAFTVNGKSYVVVVAAQELGGELFKFQPKGPSEIWIAGIDPDNPFFRRVDDPTTIAQRSEPETYYTADGPVIFYTELDEETGIKLLRRAHTGLGTEFGYDHQGYGGPWATMFRDNKNCSCTPFAIADSYVERPEWQFLLNRQSLRATMGPEGKLYFPVLELTGTPPPPPRYIAFDTHSHAEAFRLEEGDVSSGFIGTNNLIDAAGNFFLAGNEQINKFTSDGAKLWSAPIRGLPRALQFAPDGNVIFFTWNGWTQVVDPTDGQALHEEFLTPGREYPDTMECLTSGTISDCAYIDAAATNFVGSMVFTTYTLENGNAVIQGYQYQTDPIGMSLIWTSQELVGNASSPVLSNDYARVYVQTEDGRLLALDAETGATIWDFELGFSGPAGVSGAKTPVVNEHGYILPGGKFTDSPDYDFIGIVRDSGDSVDWVFQDFDYAPESLGAAGRDGRFVLAARRLADDEFVLLVVDPVFGILGETPWMDAPRPIGFTGVTVREDGWVFLGTVGQLAVRAYEPDYGLAME